jgi:hypothetical protein
MSNISLIHATEPDAPNKFDILVFKRKLTRPVEMRSEKFPKTTSFFTHKRDFHASCSSISFLKKHIVDKTASVSLAVGNG